MSYFVYTCLSVLSAVVLRCMIALHPHSGQGKPPIFGDYEAQRHWMEITYHLPVDQWYINGTKNDLLYWGLDYPPLSAYHSWLLGKISHSLNASWVELNKSRGHESYSHKVFMRNSVLAADIFTYIPAVVVYFFTCSSQHTSRSYAIAAALLTLVYPGLVLIDFGHFQYNCVSLGLTLWAVIGLCKGHDLLGSVAFTLALNYKQMSLYHALPFFAYLLGGCFKSQNSLLAGLWKLSKLSIIVILTFVICWFPFLHRLDLVLQVVHRIFPFARGLYEDKVANLWCTLSTVIKLKQIFDLSTLIRISLVSTFVVALPSTLHLLMKPSLARFHYTLVNSSLVFFLFSFQVHEKSILLAALPVCLLLPTQPLLAVWFLIVSTFSMFPLLHKDELSIPYIALMIIFYLLSDLCLIHFSSPLASTDHSKIGIQSQTTSATDQSTGRIIVSVHNRAVSLAFWASVAGMALLTLLTLLAVPPRHLPDLFVVLISVYSCAHFVAFLVIFHWLQFTVTDGDVDMTWLQHQRPVSGRSHKLKAH